MFEKTKMIEKLKIKWKKSIKMGEYSKKKAF